MKILSSVTAGLLFTSGALMCMGSTTAFPTGGTITGLGIYDENGSNFIRPDNLSIQAIPEPSGAILLGAAGFLLLLRHRR